MPKITFLPENRCCEVEAGTPLVKAAELCEVLLPLPCAGKGLCGKCLVRVEKGSVDFDNNGKLSTELIEQGYVLACKSTTTGQDAEILVMSRLNEERGQFSDALSHIGIDSALLPTAEDLRPLAICSEITVDAPVLLDGLSDYDRLRDAVREQLGVEEIDLPLMLLRTLPDVLRERDGSIYLWHHTGRATAHIVDIRVVKPLADYGVAVDIGTTTVAIQLVDMMNERVLGTTTRYNAQIERGMDVISRISYAKTPERIEEMRRLVVETVNSGISSLCQDQGIDVREVHNLTIGGNTTMVEMFLGITPNYIRLDPYTPAVFGVPYYRAEELQLAANPNACVWFAPAVGSYVGGDITAGILCTDFARDSEELCLFIDIGTNGEIVCGNNDFLMGCACSAGPAFEGGGIEKGMRASEGAIEQIDVDPATGESTYTVIGGGAPKGICGSGLISLIAQLFEVGIVDPRGKFDRSGKFPTVFGDKNARYYITPLEEGNTGIYITETDIDNLIRAKAAIYSACLTMLRSVGMEFDNLAKIYIAGGFGRYVDIEKAQTIGLLPDLDREKFIYIGNSALVGSFMALVSQKHREKVTELANRITYMDLSNEAGYMDEYISAMFIPHTNEKLFRKKK